MTQLPELPWIDIARLYIGEREIPGAEHNPWIVSIWKRIKAGWFIDDETPWCAGFVAYCCVEAGLPIVGPAKVAQALAWANHGLKLNAPAYGCKHFVEVTDLAEVKASFQASMSDLRDDVRTATATMGDVRDAVIAMTATGGKPTVRPARRRATKAA